MYLADVFNRNGRDLFSDLERLINAFDQSGSNSALRPPSSTGLDLWANENALQITVDAPGLDPSSIDLTVLGDTLTIRGAVPAANEQRTWLRRERTSGTFARTVHLPYPVEADKAEARYTDGVLSITLHRHAGSKPQRIAVQAA